LTVCFDLHRCTSLLFFTHPATTELYPLSLHDALPICDDACRTPRARRAHRRRTRSSRRGTRARTSARARRGNRRRPRRRGSAPRSEEHTSELQSPCNLVCRLLLEKKKKQNKTHEITTI